MRMLVSQIGGSASMETREFKIAATEFLLANTKLISMRSWSSTITGHKSIHLQTCIMVSRRKERSTVCYSPYHSKSDNKFGRHQPGGTGMVCRHEFTQNAMKPSIDLRGLGRWCSWLFFCNQAYMTRIVFAYRPCARKVKGLKTKMVYQQHMGYIQSRGLQTDLVDLFDSNLSMRSRNREIPKKG